MTIAPHRCAPTKSKKHRLCWSASMRREQSLVIAIAFKKRNTDMKHEPNKSDARRSTVTRIVGLGVLLFLISLVVGCAEKTSQEQAAFRVDKESKQYTQLQTQDSSETFRFAVIGDRTGGHRSGVLQATVGLLNLIQPNFVMSVGDFIEGYVDDEKVLKSQWQEIDELLKPLTMPLFFVPGNHDINFDPSEKLWFNRVGATRSYSHFVYKDVLFLMISTEDPPKKDPGQGLLDKYDSLKTGKVSSKDESKKIIAELEDWAGKINISESQVKYFKKVLADNPKVRWTIGFMHSPPWAISNPGNFAKIESLLVDRPYTMFAGHTHTYNYTLRNGRDYITMGMTGAGAPGNEVGHMDHVAWVTMTDKGPVISNLLLNGILDKQGAVPTLQEFLLYRPR